MHNLARLRRVEKAQAWDKGYQAPVARLVSAAKTPHAARTAQRLRGAVRRKPLRANRLGRMRGRSSWPSPRPSPIAHRETGVLPNALWGEGAQPRRKSLRPRREGGPRQGDRSLGQPATHQWVINLRRGRRSRLTLLLRVRNQRMINAAVSPTRQGRPTIS